MPHAPCADEPLGVLLVADPGRLRPAPIVGCVTVRRCVADFGREGRVAARTGTTGAVTSPPDPPDVRTPRGVYACRGYEGPAVEGLAGADTRRLLGGGGPTGTR